MFNIEYKGIEVVRRDGFALARNVLKKIIGIMMDGQSTDVSDVFEQIYTYGRQLN